MDIGFLLHSRAAGPRLRIGLLVDGITAPRWVAEVIGQLLASDFATVCLVVLNDSSSSMVAPTPAGGSLARRALSLLTDPVRRRNLLFGLYQRWDARNVDPATDPLTPVDCSERLAGVRTLRVTPIANRFVHRFEGKDLEVLRGDNLDVLIRFGFNILRGGVLDVARYGVWSYHHGDNEYYRGGPAYFWELVEEHPCSGAVLQVLSEKLDDGRILCKGVFATELCSSQARNRVRPYWGAATFIIQKLHELHQDGWDRVAAGILPSPSYKGRREIYRAPTNGEMAAWLAKLAWRAARNHLGRQSRTLHWRLGIRQAPRPLVTDDMGADLSSFRSIDSPPGHYYADPFVVEDAGRRLLFFEDYDCESEIGTIRCAELDGLALVLSREVLRRPYHLSYPCVFRDGDRWYMIPETATTGRVELYSARRFPDEWQFERCLLKAEAVDSTIWIESGTYWLFVTRIEPRGNGGQLWLYFSESLAGEWRAHPANPLSTDVRFARGAGAIFRRDGRLYRPSQDDTIRYGRRLLLNEIVVLDAENYCERLTVEIEPRAGDGLLGVHSYALTGDIEIIDRLS